MPCADEFGLDQRPQLPRQVARCRSQLRYGGQGGLLLLPEFEHADIRAAHVGLKRKVLLCQACRFMTEWRSLDQILDAVLCDCPPKRLEQVCADDSLSASRVWYAVNLAENRRTQDRRGEECK